MVSIALGYAIRRIRTRGIWNEFAPLRSICIDQITRNLVRTHAPLDEDEFWAPGGPHRPITMDAPRDAERQEQRRAHTQHDLKVAI